MLRRFFLVCASLFLLAGSYYLGSTSASAQGSVFRLIGPTYAVVGSTVYHLEVANPPQEWRQMPYTGEDLPPVPVSSLISLFSGTAVTESGEGWIRNASGWVSVGQIPGTSSTMRTTWGSVKAAYR